MNLTESSANRVREISKQADNAGKRLCICLDGCGRSGISCGLVFDEKRDNDFGAETDGVSLLVDPASADYLRGAAIDWRRRPAPDSRSPIRTRSIHAAAEILLAGRRWRDRSTRGVDFRVIFAQHLQVVSDNLAP